MSNVVLMGMGEPLLNYDAVWQAVETWNDGRGFNLGARRITLSTAGYVPGIDRLASERLQVGLAVSLHAADDTLRDQLVQIPLEAAVPLEDEEYYHFQVVGVRVITDGGESLGRVAEVLVTGANDVYLVRGPRGEVLIPAIEDVVRSLDLEARQMVVTLLPGLLKEE